MPTKPPSTRPELTQGATPSSRKPSRFEADWGRAIEEVGYVQVPVALVENFHKLGLKPLDLSIVLVLMRYWHHGKPTWVSKGKIARQVGVEPRSVQRRIAALVERKLLIREKRTHHYGDSDTNLYHLEPLVAALVPYAKQMTEERRKKREQQKTLKPGLRPYLRAV